MKSKNVQAKSQKGQEIPNLTEEQARTYFESQRWPNGPICVHCTSNNVYLLQGESTRRGLYECRECRKQFTVTVGTVMEDSHLPLATWARAFHFIATSKKGFSALQLQRNCGIGSYRTAWFLGHRIREAMRYEPVSSMLKNEVQVDETYIGGKPRAGSSDQRGKGITKKTPVIVLVETNGMAKSQPLANTKASTIQPILRDGIEQTSKIVTDEKPAYIKAARGFSGGHVQVNHRQDEYVSPEGYTTNTAESYFSLLKRGHYGVYHSMSKKHLHRYCAEFDFRWNGRDLNDVDRRNAAVRGAEGKRLMAKQPIQPNNLDIKDL